MMPSLNQLLMMVGRSLRNPREGAEEVLALGVPREGLWPILGLVVVLSVMLAEITGLIAVSTAGEQMEITGILANPAMAGALQLVLLVVMVVAVHRVGRAMGGTGSFEESLLLMSWLQFIMVVIQVFQTAALMIAPPLAGLVGIFALVLFFWLLTHFVAVIHGFTSLAQVFVMILVSGFAISFALMLVLAILGVEMPTAPGGI